MSSPPNHRQILETSSITVKVFRDSRLVAVFMHLENTQKIGQSIQWPLPPSFAATVCVLLMNPAGGPKEACLVLRALCHSENMVNSFASCRLGAVVMCWCHLEALQLCFWNFPVTCPRLSYLLSVVSTVHK